MTKPKMTFDKYIDNPSGGSVYTNRNMYKQMYSSKFDTLMVRERGTVQYELFVTNDSKDTHYIYMKIPSEVVPNFYYDVVIQLSAQSNEDKNNVNMRRYAVKFYSNDPAFVYTFAHSFKKNNLFIPDLESKMSKTALTTKATVRNPKDDVWYVKSLYFAYLTMEKYNLFSKAMYGNKAKDYDKKYLLKQITDADIKVAKRQSEGERIAKEKAIEKAKEKKKTLTNNTKPNTSNITTASKITKTVKTTNVTRSTKRTKFTGRKKP